MSPLPRAMLQRWPERWRFPRLVMALTTGSEDLTNNQITVALLQGMAEPPIDLGDSMRKLTAAGELAAAQSLVDQAPMPDEEVAAARNLLVEARRGHSWDIDRRWLRLESRARRAGGSVARPDGLTAAADLRPQKALQLLDGVEMEVEKMEERRAQELEGRLRALGSDQTDWTFRILASIEAREFPTVDRMLDEGPDVETIVGPLAIARPDGWSWRQRSQDDILNWYLGEHARPPLGFVERWKPDPQDDDAWGLLRAVQGLAGDPSIGAARKLVRELDRLIGAEDIRHDVRPIGDGFASTLLGVRDARLAALGLPEEFPLWIASWASQAPTELGRPAVWFVLDQTPSNATGELAPVDLVTLLPLIAPLAGRQQTRGERRINLLRTVCRGLPPAIVLGSKSVVLPHEALAWALDLIGLRAAPFLIDVLITETRGRPANLAEALASMMAGPHPATELTVDMVSEWRLSREITEDE